jgi:hypothetical protein
MSDDEDELQQQQLFHSQGFLKLPLLSRDTSERLRNFILNDLQEALQQPEESQKRRFSAIRKRTNRWDLKLHTSLAVKTAMQEILQRDFLNTHLAPLFQCQPEDVVLAELGSLISHPGAQAQEWHADTLHTGPLGPDCVVCFITLQDTPLSMGPTQILPDTHTEDFHRTAVANFPPKGLMPSYVAPKSMQAGYERAGEACLMDCRLYHRGGANTHDTSGDGQRIVFYFTVRSRTMKAPGGLLWTILEDLKGMQLIDFWE